MRNLQAYLHSDRQWPRMLRIRHARMNAKHSSGDDLVFWNSVLSANGVDGKGRPLASTSYLASKEAKHVTTAA